MPTKTILMCNNHSLTTLTPLHKLPYLKSGTFVRRKGWAETIPGPKSDQTE